MLVYINVITADDFQNPKAPVCFIVVSGSGNPFFFFMGVCFYSYIEFNTLAAPYRYSFFSFTISGAQYISS